MSSLIEAAFFALALLLLVLAARSSLTARTLRIRKNLEARYSEWAELDKETVRAVKQAKFFILLWVMPLGVVLGHWILGNSSVPAALGLGGGYSVYLLGTAFKFIPKFDIASLWKRENLKLEDWLKLIAFAALISFTLTVIFQLFFTPEGKQQVFEALKDIKKE
jgi:hypothetical protein